MNFKIQSFDIQIEGCYDHLHLANELAILFEQLVSKYHNLIKYEGLEC